MGESSWTRHLDPWPTSLERRPCSLERAIENGPTPESTLRLLKLIFAAEHFRQSVSASVGLGTSESQALAVLSLHGGCGQTELVRDLKLTSSAGTALVDRLERQGVAERTPHPRDRRRTNVRLTERGLRIAEESERCLGQALGRVDPLDVDRVVDGLSAIADELDLIADQVASGRADPVPTHALPAS